MAREEMGAGGIYHSERQWKYLAAILDKSMSIVEGPMGYGKTVAVREYLKMQQVCVIWIAMADCRDDSWAYFCRQILKELEKKQIAQNQDEAAEVIRKLLDWGSPDTEEEMNRTVQALWTIRFPKPTVLVLDDYQVVNTLKNGWLLEHLFDRNWPNLHGVLITRDKYRGNQDMLWLKGRLAVLGRDCFEMRPEEIREYYQQWGVRLPAETAEQLAAITGGWMAALYLYLLRYRNGGGMTTPSEIFELLDTGMFSDLLEERQRFLSVIGPLREFTFGQAENVWTRIHEPCPDQIRSAETKRILNSLCRENAFVAYDDVAGVFRVHPLLAEFLEKRFFRLTVEEQNRFLNAYGDCFFSEKNYGRALVYYERAENMTGFLESMRMDRGRSIKLADWPMYRRAMDMISAEEQDAYPDVMLTLLINSFLNDDKSRRQRLEYVVEDWLERHSEGQPEYRETSRGMTLCRGLFSYNDVDVMAEQFGEVQEEINDLINSAGPAWTMGSPSVLMMFYHRPGHLDDTLEKVGRYLPLYNGLAGNQGAGGGVLMQAETFYHRGDMGNAETAAHEAEIVASELGLYVNCCIAKLIQIRCAVMRGDYEQTIQIWDSLLQIRKESDNEILNHTIDMGLGCLYLPTGRFDMVPDWIRSGQDMRSHVHMFAYPAYMTMHGRCLLEEGQYTRVIGLFRVLSKDDMYNRHALFVLYGHIFTAAARAKLGQETEALEDLMTALDLAAADRIYMVFAENRDLLKDLFECLKCRPEYQNMIKVIEELSERLAAGICRVFEEKQRGMLKKRNGRDSMAGALTKREREMARLACAGKTNREIAEELFLAPSTVKRALVSVFRKLGIHGRAELEKHREYFMDEV